MIMINLAHPVTIANNTKTAIPTYPSELLKLLKDPSSFLCQETRSTIEKVRVELGESYLPLLLQPGILSRTEELIDFAKKNNIPEPLTLRQLFAKHLGCYTDVYRGLALTKQEKEAILVNGMGSAFARNEKSYIEALKRMLIEGVSSLKSLHTAEKGCSPLLSLSEDEDLAILIARGQTDKKREHAFVFILEIPKILTINGRNYQEFFAFFRIEPEYIKGCQKHLVIFEIYIPRDRRPWYA
ncbi:hypothetical protein A3J90_01540 [candidate division WOR-1 bacterium RIFOXYC2_FULL_37_10]|nr:MAG: hypothetical protein A3J90_01540 [candidate division WOR-1 bacterium RIFOXYC2_FULL_37_10]